jgi:Signal transduction histidine kinase
MIVGLLISVLLLAVMMFGYISEQKNKKKLLRRIMVVENASKNTEKIFNAILQNIHAFVLYIDKDFQVVFTNYYAITGDTQTDKAIRVGDLLKCSNTSSFSNECGASEFCKKCSIKNKIKEAFNTKQNFTDLETSLNVKDANGNFSECYVYISGEYLQNDGKDFMVVTVHDITRLKVIENELQKAREKAEKADRFKSEFLANMSHEIRTPLNAIVGFSELLAVAEQDEERSEYLEIIRLNNDLLQQLVADILDISKIEAGTLEFTYSEVDVNQIILDLGQYFQLKSEEQNTQINVLIEVPEIHNTLYSDRNRLMQVLSNFMTNALKFTEKGNVTIGYKNCDKNLHFYVRDTGKGIAPNKLELIFKRFVRLDTQKVGAGLGLAICEKIVHRLGGEIGVDSIEGEGSTFWFTIPVDEKESL